MKDWVRQILDDRRAARREALIMTVVMVCFAITMFLNIWLLGSEILLDIRHPCVKYSPKTAVILMKLPVFYHPCLERK